jgi:hypothetical protein
MAPISGARPAVDATRCSEKVVTSEEGEEERSVDGAEAAEAAEAALRGTKVLTGLARKRPGLGRLVCAGSSVALVEAADKMCVYVSLAMPGSDAKATHVLSFGSCHRRSLRCAVTLAQGQGRQRQPARRVKIGPRPPLLGVVRVSPCDGAAIRRPRGWQTKGSPARVTSEVEQPEVAEQHRPACVMIDRHSWCRPGRPRACGQDRHARLVRPGHAYCRLVPSAPLQRFAVFPARDTAWPRLPGAEADKARTADPRRRCVHLPR